MIYSARSNRVQGFDFIFSIQSTLEDGDKLSIPDMGEAEISEDPSTVMRMKISFKGHQEIYTVEPLYPVEAVKYSKS